MRIAALKAGPYPDYRIERINGELKSVALEREPRPPEHNHDVYGDDGQPVLVFDLHGTLTSDPGFPLTSAPFDGVKEFMVKMVARGCCIHVTSGSLRPGNPEVFAARLDQSQSFCQRFGLPVSWFGPKVSANAYLDDRMLNVPLTPDWFALGAAAEKIILQTFDIDDAGTYQRKDALTPVGDEIDKYPDPKDVGDDRPRGFTSSVIDIDIHRTINPAWGSSREADPDPAGVAAINGLYDQGYTIHMSCAGWNPATRGDKEAAKRVSAMRAYMGCYGIKYDQIVAKDDCDLAFDNLGVTFSGSWPAATKAILKQLQPRNQPPDATAYLGTGAIT